MSSPDGWTTVSHKKNRKKVNKAPSSDPSVNEEQTKFLNKYFELEYLSNAQIDELYPSVGFDADCNDVSGLLPSDKYGDPWYELCQDKSNECRAEVYGYYNELHERIINIIPNNPRIIDDIQKWNSTFRKDPGKIIYNPDRKSQYLLISYLTDIVKKYEDTGHIWIIIVKDTKGQLRCCQICSSEEEADDKARLIEEDGEIYINKIKLDDPIIKKNQS